jgi:hypothetical protein
VSLPETTTLPYNPLESCPLLVSQREPTSGLEPLYCSLRVIGQALQRLAEACKSRISKPFSIPRVAACCTVLRSRWYQSGIRTTCSPEFANSKKSSAACLFLPLQGVGYGLLESHRAALAPRLLPCFLSHAQAHGGNASVSLSEEVGVSWNVLCFL